MTRKITICRSCKKIMAIIVGTDNKRSADVNLATCSDCLKNCGYFDYDRYKEIRAT